jgi:ATP-dependent DNA helicase DinG
MKGESGGHSEGAVMPPYQRIIIDEAHNVEDIATEHFGGGDSKRGFMLLAGRLVGKKDRKKGLLPFTYLKMLKRKGHLPGSFMQPTSSYILGELIPHVDSMRDEVLEFFDMIGYFALDYKKEGFDSDFTSAEKKLRITDDLKEFDTWKELSDAALSSMHQTRICRKGLLKIIDALEDLPEGDDRDDFAAQLMEFKAYSDRLMRFITAIDLFFFQEEGGCVKSIDAIQRDSGLSVRLKISPVSIADAMNTNVYDILKTAVLTSATLSVNNKFDYIKDRLGLAGLGERLSELMLESPFDFKRQAFIGIPTDMPLPFEKTYERDLKSITGKSLKISGGSAFVLFTSYKLLNQLHSSLSADKNLSSYELMRQGEAPRTVLLDRFRKIKSSVIFGSDSFWEGVDVPGDALRLVVVTKLPFSVPDDPIIEARCELIEKEGLSPFMSYMLPQAVLKFKQGFGRLIRNSSDIGAVLILDSRVVKKGYGNLFIRSLPKCNVNKAPAIDILDGMKAFLGKY